MHGRAQEQIERTCDHAFGGVLDRHDAVGRLPGLDGGEHVADGAQRQGGDAEAEGAQLRLLANWNDRYYRSGDGNAAVYSDPRLIVDLKGQYRINRRAELYLEVMNLTNEFAQTFVREGGLKYNAQKQGTLYAMGVKLTY